MKTPCGYFVSLTLLMILSGCHPDSHEYLSGGCAYVDEAYNYRMILCPTRNIEPIICDYKYDDSFIIAMQLPSHETYENMKNTKLSTVRYWIRSNLNNMFYVPLTVEEFEIKRKALNVPAKLKLDTTSIHEYR